MVRPCAKYARLDCYAPLQVTAKTFAVTWSGLFPYAKFGTFWAWFGDRQDRIPSSKLLRTENIRRQNAVGIFRLVSYTHLGTFGLGSEANRRRLLRRGFTPPLAKTAEGIDHFSSALPLGRGTFHRFERLVCALLRFRERSRTIKVQLATSSSQNHRKSFTQSCLVLSIKYRH